MFTGIYYGEARLKCSGSCLSFHEDGIGTCAVDDIEGGFILKNINFAPSFYSNPLYPS